MRRVLVQRQPESLARTRTKLLCSIKHGPAAIGNSCFPSAASQQAILPNLPNIHMLEMWQTPDTMHKEWDSCWLQLPGRLCCRIYTPQGNMPSQ